MAAVAGAVAQATVEAARRQGVAAAIVENGGDIFSGYADGGAGGPFAGREHPAADRLAFRITPGEQPLAICSSSSRMGHSLSFGDCDLATVISADGALADAPWPRRPAMP